MSLENLKDATWALLCLALVVVALMLSTELFLVAALASLIFLALRSLAKRRVASEMSI